MENHFFRILLVDDYEPWRGFVISTFRNHPNFVIAAEASDGQSAIEKAQEVRPDLILLDIGLPGMNGIEAAREIRRVTPAATILFVSENRSREIAEEALRTGALGYVMKSDAGSQLLPAMVSVLQGRPFLSTSLAGHSLREWFERQSDRDEKERATVRLVA